MSQLSRFVRSRLILAMALLWLAVPVLAAEEPATAEAPALETSSGEIVSLVPEPSKSGAAPLCLARLRPASAEVSPVARPPRLKTCRCSCGAPCTTNADCGPGGKCSLGITCCAAPVTGPDGGAAPAAPGSEAASAAC